jgi:EasF-like predicted methyltransferase
MWPRTWNNGEVVDIGGGSVLDNAKERLIYALREEQVDDAKVTLPDELLYTDKGLFIWNEIIFIPEFYQTHDEIKLFQRHGADIVRLMTDKVIMIDLGAGDTRKVEHLLECFEEHGRQATYLALDISKTSLNHNVKYLADRHSGDTAFVKCAGLWGDFSNGLKLARTIAEQRLFLSLGSVLCNDDWPKAITHLKFWADELRPGDFLLVGMDGHVLPNNRKKIWDAYHSCDELYKQFFLSGFQEANRLVGEEWFKQDDWEYCAVLEDSPTTRHRVFFRAKRDIEMATIGRVFRKGEEIDWFDSHKYCERDVRLMFRKVGLMVVNVWKAPDSEFRQYLVRLKNYGEGDSDSDEDRTDADSAVSGLD